MSLNSSCLCAHGVFQAAAEYWLSLGVDGIKISGLSVASGSDDWSVLQAAVSGNRTEHTKKR